LGIRGALILEFLTLPGISTFTIAVNDQLLLAANLHNATFRGF